MLCLERALAHIKRTFNMSRSCGFFPGPYTDAQMRLPSSPCPDQTRSHALALTHAVCPCTHTALVLSLSLNNLTVPLMETAALSGAALPFCHPVCQPAPPGFYPQDSAGMALKSPTATSSLPNLAPSPHVLMSPSPLGSFPLPVPGAISSRSAFLWVPSPSLSAPLSHNPL